MIIKINELFDSKDVDSVLLRTDEDKLDTNFYYFAQLSKTNKLSSFLILRRGKKPILITTLLEYEGLKKNKNLAVLCYESEKDIARLFRKYLTGRIGINYSYYTLSSFAKLRKFFPHKKFVDISDALSKLREVKTKEEIRKISTGCKITEEVLEKVGDIVKVGMKEKELADKLEYEAKRLGAENVSFPTIVAVGKNACVPHHITGKTKISKGKILLVDFGVIFDGYCSDLTRTFFVGRADEKAKNVYAVVYNAQRTVIKMMKEGVKSDELFKVANNILKNELNEGLIHSLGHGIGIDVHDFPARMMGKSYILRENMCLTVEPGYYKNFGVRIEDDVVVKKNGCKMLSDAPKELIEI